jgi:hypothetical protein
MSGESRLYVSRNDWRKAQQAASELRTVQRNMPAMLESVRRATEAQAARDRAAFQAQQAALNSRLSQLSKYARQVEASTTQRINAARNELMNEVAEATETLRGETRQLMERQEQRFSAAMSAQRAEHKRDIADVQAQINRDRHQRAGILESARIVAQDARVMHDAIAAMMPHARYAPGELEKLTSRLALVEQNLTAGAGEAALSSAQESYLALSELRTEIMLRDTEWQSGHLAAVAVVTGLRGQIGASEHIDLVDEEAGIVADLDVDYWSDGELSRIRAEADQLAARLADEVNPPSLEELLQIAQGTAADLDAALSDAIAVARARQWACQVRVNVAEQVVQVLEQNTLFNLESEPVFAGDDQRGAFYSKLRSEDDSEIVVEVAPDETGESCVIRVFSYESGVPDQRVQDARTAAIARVLSEEGLSATPSCKPGDPDPAYRDLKRLRMQSATAAPRRR